MLVPTNPNDRVSLLPKPRSQAEIKLADIYKYQYRNVWILGYTYPYKEKYSLRNPIVSIIAGSPGYLGKLFCSNTLHS